MKKFIKLNSVLYSNLIYLSIIEVFVPMMPLIYFYINLLYLDN